MKPESATPVVRESGLTNREFLDKYARAGCVGLAGGRTFVDAAIGRAQRHLDTAWAWSRWSHAFFLQGRRADGHHWVIESDLQFRHKHIQLGVQENRVTKYHDERLYTRLAVLAFNLTPEQENALLCEGLELVAARVRYSLRELFGALVAMRHQKLRGANNLLARDHALFCSAMVRHMFRKTGVDLVPGIDVKNTAPEDIARSPLIRRMFVLERPEKPRLLAQMDRRFHRVKTKLREAREKRARKS